jgi:hypothetical protein
MELRRHLNVIWRFKWLVLGSLVLGAILAGISLMHVTTKPSAEWRQKLVYSSLSMVYVTQPGFPEGRVLAAQGAAIATQGAAAQGAAKGQAGGQQQQTPFFADPSRFSGLTLLYSFLLSSQEIKGLMGPLPPGSEVSSSQITSGSGSKAQALPLLQVDAHATDPADAKRLNGEAISALKRYVTARQQKNGILDKDRVQLSVITPPQTPTVFQGRSYTGAVVLFLLCAMLGIALAYVWENLYPSWGGGGRAGAYDGPYLDDPLGLDEEDETGDHVAGPPRRDIVPG